MFKNKVPIAIFGVDTYDYEIIVLEKPHQT